MIVGPRVGLRFEVHGTQGALRWELERMNELERFQLSDDGGDEGYTTVLAGPAHPDFAAFQPGAGVPMGYDDLRVLEARNFLAASATASSASPGWRRCSPPRASSPRSSARPRSAARGSQAR